MSIASSATISKQHSERINVSIRKNKRKLLRRFWFSTPFTIDGEYWPGSRHGLAYGDVRSHTGVRRCHVGQLALMEVPYDDLAAHRKKYKQVMKEERRKLNRAVREWRRERHLFMEGLSFRAVRNIYQTSKIGAMSPALREHVSRELNLAFMKQRHGRVWGTKLSR
jgi:hypothetical protein